VTLKHLVGEPGSPGPLLETFTYAPTEPMLDGPVMRRLAVVDFDPATGMLVPGIRFQAGKAKKGPGYPLKDEADPEAADLRQLSVFTTVLKVMQMFEEADVLGRPLVWGFRGEQLLIVPNAGTMANAFYHRGSRSLQFFAFDGEIGGKPTRVHTCLSPDIVAHEATHAILDGIAPDLYDATSPQSLALHEAMADVGAVLFAIRTKKLSARVLDLSKGDLRSSEAFNQIARQFGEANGDTGRPLRDLASDVTLAAAGPHPPSNEPHDLSLILSSALYALLMARFEVAKADIVRERAERGMKERPDPEFSASGEALYRAGQTLKRVALRALDYLPPGEISFADYARAVIAADTDTNPVDEATRDFLRKEFRRRGIVASADELTVAAPGIELPTGFDLDLLLSSDWAAYRFAEAHREALSIPEGVAFEVRPRLAVRKATFRGKGRAEVDLLILKVLWRETEVASFTSDVVQEISVARGTTLVIDRETAQVMTVLTTATSDPHQSGETARRDRGMRAAFLERGLADGTFDLASSDVQVQDGVLRLKGTGQLLHMAGH
jgi:hypothetical protein